jgi:flagellar biosynthesis protein FlhF
VNTDVRTFRADSLQEALDIVRREMGDAAVILQTRHLEQRRMWPWSPRKQEIEITAGSGSTLVATPMGNQLAVASSDHVGNVATGDQPSETSHTRDAANLGQTRPQRRFDAGDLAPPPPLLGPKADANITNNRSHRVQPPKWSPNDVIPDSLAGSSLRQPPSNMPSQVGPTSSSTSKSPMEPSVRSVKGSPQRSTTSTGPAATGDAGLTQEAKSETGRSLAAPSPRRGVESHSADTAKRAPSRLDLPDGPLTIAARARLQSTPPGSNDGPRTAVSPTQNSGPLTRPDATLPPLLRTISPAASLRTSTPPPAPASAATASTAAAAVATAPRASQPLPTADSTTPDELRARLDQLQQMILDLGRTRSNSPLNDVPAELFPWFTRLVEAEVEDNLARELIVRLRASLPSKDWQNPAAVSSTLSALIEAEFLVAPPIHGRRNAQRIAALIGPTGVGKTTTLAKLAGNLRLRQGVKVGLITVDTYRIAAVEQLRTYAEIIDLPMRVVTTPDEMQHAVRDLQEMDVILIDTAGRSPNDDARIQELQSILAAADPDEVHLVVSLATGVRSAELAALHFRAVGVHRVILSKLDEATGGGTLLNFARRLSLPISYITTGQNVPEDLELADRPRLAQWVLGQSPLPK